MQTQTYGQSGSKVVKGNSQKSCIPPRPSSTHVWEIISPSPLPHNHHSRPECMTKPLWLGRREGRRKEERGGTTERRANVLPNTTRLFYLYRSTYMYVYQIMCWDSIGVLRRLVETPLPPATCTLPYRDGSREYRYQRYGFHTQRHARCPFHPLRRVMLSHCLCWLVNG